MTLSTSLVTLLFPINTAVVPPMPITPPTSLQEIIPISLNFQATSLPTWSLKEIPWKKDSMLRSTPLKVQCHKTLSSTPTIWIACTELKSATTASALPTTATCCKPTRIWTTWSPTNGRLVKSGVRFGPPWPRVLSTPPHEYRNRYNTKVVLR